MFICTSYSSQAIAPVLPQPLVSPDPRVSAEEMTDISTITLQDSLTPASVHGSAAFSPLVANILVCSGLLVVMLLCALLVCVIQVRNKIILD